MMPLLLLLTKDIKLRIKEQRFKVKITKVTKKSKQNIYWSNLWSKYSEVQPIRGIGCVWFGSILISSRLRFFHIFIIFSFHSSTSVKTMSSEDHYSHHFSPSKRRKTSPPEYKCDRSLIAELHSETLSENIYQNSSDKVNRKRHKSRKISENSNSSSSSLSVTSSKKVNTILARTL